MNKFFKLTRMEIEVIVLALLEMVCAHILLGVNRRYLNLIYRKSLAIFSML